jgi:hypothetical protein
VAQCLGGEGGSMIGRHSGSMLRRRGDSMEEAMQLSTDAKRLSGRGGRGTKIENKSVKNIRVKYLAGTILVHFAHIQ